MVPVGKIETGMVGYYLVRKESLNFVRLRLQLQCRSPLQLLLLMTSISVTSLPSFRLAPSHILSQLATVHYSHHQ